MAQQRLRSRTSSPQLPVARGCTAVTRFARRVLGFRDQLIHACMHAGYSALLRAPHTRAGEVCGFNVRCPRTPTCVYSPGGDGSGAAGRPDTADRAGAQPVTTSWRVCYSEQVNELLPAQDVRFDGSACRIRQKPSSGQATSPHLSAALPTQPGDLYDAERDGRVWCVSVEHSDRLIFVQRAHRNASGVVTKVGRSLIIGNCLSKFYHEQPSSALMIASGSESRWQCPSCRGMCTCAACRRKKDTTGAGAGAGKGKGKKALKTEKQTVREDEEEPPALETSGKAGDGVAPSNGVHVEYAGEDEPAVIHLPRTAVKLPASYSPAVTSPRPPQVEAMELDE